MKKIFKSKILAFYVVSISFVLILFKVVTDFGANYLKAPPEIGGNYLLLNNQNLPPCLNSENLLLSIQQSGVYLNGYLGAKNQQGNSTLPPEERPSLVGKWQEKNQSQLLMLSGTLNQTAKCQKQTVTIFSVVNGKTLQGEISLTSFPEKVKFIAVKETSENSPKQTTH